MSEAQTIITLDGPAGSGKSTMAKLLSERLGFQFLDTGATYRAVTFSAQEAGIDLDDGVAVVEVARKLEIHFEDIEGGQKVFINGKDCSAEIRTREVTTQIYKVADNPDIRDILVALQRNIASEGCWVTEGRDQGTVVFPNARWKFFMNASPEIRAKRRLEQMEEQGQELPDFETLLKEVKERDKGDYNRAVGALKKADDAIEIMSDDNTREKTLGILIEIVKKDAPELFD
jgi:cytidylate kinase